MSLVQGRPAKSSQMGEFMHIRTNEDMNRAILHGIREIPEDVDLIVGIPRSGLLAATLFSLYLNKPMTDFRGLLEGRILSTGKRPVKAPGDDPIAAARRILVVDDCISQGLEMDKCRAEIDAAGLADKTTFLAVYSFPEKPHKADIVLEIVPRPMAFQWAVMHSPSLSLFCVDIDGILCADPIDGEDDDGPRYLNFLKNAKPLFTPVNEIGWLVTCRLEKYRTETEAWLTRHGVRYRNLVMMDYPNRLAREKDKRHAEYKADVYRQSGAQLFIESNPALAEKIADLTGRPVMSFTTNALFGRPMSQKIDILHTRFQHQMRRVRRIPSRIQRVTAELLSGSGGPYSAK